MQLASRPRPRALFASSKAYGIERLDPRVMLTRSLGVDVSSNNSSINWSTAHTAGIDFAYVKATEGATFTSSTFASQMSGAKAAGVIPGAYHYARYDNGNSAATEAQHFLDVASAYITPGYLRPVVDIEQSTTMTKSQVSSWTNTFANAVFTATGVKPLIYTFTSYATSYLDSTVTQWDLWMAQYPSGTANPQTGAPNSTTPWASTAWKIWQYTDQGSVSGISGIVDRDVYNGDLATLSTQLAVQPAFAAGQTIKVSGTSGGLKAWDTSASNGTYVTEPEGTVGTIVSGPVFAAGYNRYEIRWAGESVTRWSAQDYLAKVTVAPSASSAVSPTNGQAFRDTAPPTSLDFADATNATSYDVYVDGTLAGNVNTCLYTPSAAFSYGPHTWSVTAKNSVGSTASGTFNFYIGKFLTGESVKVVNAPSGLKAWDSAASNGTYVLKSNGTTATVLGGGPVFANGYWRWQLMYAGDTVARWSAEDYLALV